MYLFFLPSPPPFFFILKKIYVFRSAIIHIIFESSLKISSFYFMRFILFTFVPFFLSLASMISAPRAPSQLQTISLGMACFPLQVTVFQQVQAQQNYHLLVPALLLKAIALLGIQSSQVAFYRVKFVEQKSKMETAVFRAARPWKLPALEPKLPHIVVNSKKTISSQTCVESVLSLSTISPNCAMVTVALTALLCQKAVGFSLYHFGRISSYALRLCWQHINMSCFHLNVLEAAGVQPQTKYWIKN